eukprot:776353_1
MALQSENGLDDVVLSAVPKRIISSQPSLHSGKESQLVAVILELRNAIKTISVNVSQSDRERKRLEGQVNQLSGRLGEVVRSSEHMRQSWSTTLERIKELELRDVLANNP